MLRSTPKNSRDLFQILVAAAWIDGSVQPQERSYLEKIALERGLAEDAKIKFLLSTQASIPAQQCYQWLQDYLGSRPSSEDYHNLMSDLSALLYSDNDITVEEANLLTQIQELNPDNLTSNSALDKFLHGIKKMYRKGINSI
jgi:hypothetical protein